MLLQIFLYKCAGQLSLQHNKLKGVSDLRRVLEINPVYPSQRTQLLKTPPIIIVIYFRPSARLSPDEARYPQNPHQMASGFGSWMHNYLAPHQFGPRKLAAAVLFDL